MMVRAPAFWSGKGKQWPASLLSPASAIMAAATARRVARPGWRAPVPVICCGNATVGGSGKTTVALDIGQRLAESGHHVHFILRGYGGSNRSTLRVAAGDAADRTGDEALLLMQVAPTWIGADRIASARAAFAAGATVLIMDDGLQNPSLVKNLSLLVVDGAYGFGNGRVIPAGPLREPVAAAAARCDAAIVIGEGEPPIPPALPVLRARLVPDASAFRLSGRRVLAFAGIGVPDKFFRTVAEVGAVIVCRVPYPDHHPYEERELDRLIEDARSLDAIPVTTAKDLARIPPERRRAFTAVRITLAWQDEAALIRILSRTLKR